MANLRAASSDLENEEGYKNLTPIYQYLVRECARYFVEFEKFEKRRLENPEAWDAFSPQPVPSESSEDGIKAIQWPFFDEKDKHFTLILAVVVCVMRKWEDEITRRFIASFFFFTSSKLSIKDMTVENVRTYMALTDTFEEKFPGVSANYDVAFQVFSSFAL